MPKLDGQALLIANANYIDKTISALSGTIGDVRALEAVLSAPTIGSYHVQTAIDESIHQLRQRIEGFFQKHLKMVCCYFICPATVPKTVTESSIS